MHGSFIDGGWIKYGDRRFGVVLMCSFVMPAGQKGLCLGSWGCMTVMVEI